MTFPLDSMTAGLKLICQVLPFEKGSTWHWCFAISMQMVSSFGCGGCSDLERQAFFRCPVAVGRGVAHQWSWGNAAGEVTLQWGGGGLNWWEWHTQMRKGNWLKLVSRLNLSLLQLHACYLTMAANEKGLLHIVCKISDWGKVCLCQ